MAFLYKQIDANKDTQQAHAQIIQTHRTHAHIINADINQLPNFFCWSVEPLFSVIPQNDLLQFMVCFPPRGVIPGSGL